MMSMGRFPALFAENYDQYKSVFKDGAGVGYEHFEGFHEFMSQISARKTTKLITKAAGLSQRLEAGDRLRIADLGCGEGAALRGIAREYANTDCIGLDPFVGQQKVEPNLKFLQADASADLFGLKPEVVGEGFDLIMALDVIHDLPDPQKALDNVAKALKDNGVFLMMEVNCSSHLAENLALGESERSKFGFLSAIGLLHCRCVSRAQGGPGLGSMWGREAAKKMIDAAGMTIKKIDGKVGDGVNCFYVCCPKKLQRYMVWY